MLRRIIPLQQRKHHRRKVTVLGVGDNILQRGGARQVRRMQKVQEKEVAGIHDDWEEAFLVL